VVKTKFSIKKTVVNRAPVAHTCNPNQEATIRRIVVQTQPRQIVHEILSQKTFHSKKADGAFKVKALSSNLSTAKKNCNLNFISCFISISLSFSSPKLT
jgi:hypothetical protein